MKSSVRRIVTGVDETGKSCIVADGPSPAERVVEHRPGYRVTDLWCTARGTMPDAADGISGYRGVQPPSGGSVFRIIDVPPESSDPAERRKAAEATFRSVFPDAHRESADSDAKHPGMHQTPTVDYALVLEGEITAVLEQEETVMRAGDVLIQRATRHAWANRSGQPARIAFILLNPR